MLKLSKTAIIYFYKYNDLVLYVDIFDRNWLQARRGPSDARKVLQRKSSHLSCPESAWRERQFADWQLQSHEKTHEQNTV